MRNIHVCITFNYLNAYSNSVVITHGINQKIIQTHTCSGISRKVADVNARQLLQALKKNAQVEVTLNLAK